MPSAVSSRRPRVQDAAPCGNQLLTRGRVATGSGSGRVADGPGSRRASGRSGPATRRSQAHRSAIVRRSKPRAWRSTRSSASGLGRRCRSRRSGCRRARSRSGTRARGRASRAAALVGGHDQVVHDAATGSSGKLSPRRPRRHLAGRGRGGPVRPRRPGPGAARLPRRTARLLRDPRSRQAAWSGASIACQVGPSVMRPASNSESRRSVLTVERDRLETPALEAVGGDLVGWRGRRATLPGAGSAMSEDRPDHLPETSARGSAEGPSGRGSLRRAGLADGQTLRSARGGHPDVDAEPADLGRPVVLRQVVTDQVAGDPEAAAAIRLGGSASGTGPG